MRDEARQGSTQTVEAWARSFIESTVLQHKREPGPPPSTWHDAPLPLRLDAPGRPPELVIADRSIRSRGRKTYRSVRRRAEILHTFWHHELAAAELMAWALLAFPDTPRGFRRGLVTILLDEVRHMGLYERRLGELGHRIGDFPVRDWFWERIPRVTSARSFVAVMSLGFEGGNLDHASRFATIFRDAEDPDSAALIERVGREELPHVRFGMRWFTKLEAGARADPPEDAAPEEAAAEEDGALFETWRAALPAPLSPMLMQGEPMNVEMRRRAGYSDAFLTRLRSWRREPSGS